MEERVLIWRSVCCEGGFDFFELPESDCGSVEDDIGVPDEVNGSVEIIGEPDEITAAVWVGWSLGAVWGVGIPDGIAATFGDRSVGAAAAAVVLFVELDSRVGVPDPVLRLVSSLLSDSEANLLTAFIADAGNPGKRKFPARVMLGAD